MKNTLRYILSTVGLVLVLLFCVSATAAITNSQTIMSNSLSEPMSMLLLGFALIGFGSFIKSRLSR